MDPSDFPTARQRMIETASTRWRDGFRFSTEPVMSTLPLALEVTDARPAVAPVMAHARLFEGQILNFFSYKMGDNIPTGIPNVLRTANAFDTTLTEARRCPGGRAMAIEGVSLTLASKRIRWATGVIPDGVSPAVRDAYLGLTPMVDPFALASPVQYDSPANLEELFNEHVLPALDVVAIWGDTNLRKMGYLDQLPEGTGKSALRSHGEPHVTNRFILSEGFVWNAEGNPRDQEMIIQCTTRREIVFPITLPPSLFGTTLETRIAPERIMLDLRMRLHGAMVGPINSN